MTPDSPWGQKLALVMVGLPARGKTFVARKVQRYLSWLGYRTLWVNVGDYRRAHAGAKQPAGYFAPDNTATRGERERFAIAALDDLLDWFARGGEVGIYDATNAERLRRTGSASGARPRAVSGPLHRVHLRRSGDHRRQRPPQQARPARLCGHDPTRRSATSRPGSPSTREATLRVDDDEGSYVKLIDAGKQVISNRIAGYLPSRLAFFLMQITSDASPDLAQPARGERVQRARAGSAATPRSPSAAGVRGAPRRIRARAAPRTRWCGRAPSSERLPRRPRLGAELGPGGRSTRSTPGSATGSPTRRSKSRMPDEFAARARTSSATAIRGENHTPTSSSGSSRSSSSSNGSVTGLDRRPSGGHPRALRLSDGQAARRMPVLTVPLHTVIELTPTEYDYRGSASRSRFAQRPDDRAARAGATSPDRRSRRPPFCISPRTPAPMRPREPRTPVRTSTVVGGPTRMGS